MLCWNLSGLTLIFGSVKILILHLNSSDSQHFIIPIVNELLLESHFIFWSQRVGYLFKISLLLVIMIKFISLGGDDLLKLVLKLRFESSLHARLTSKYLKHFLLNITHLLSQVFVFEIEVRQVRFQSLSTSLFLVPLLQER